MKKIIFYLCVLAITLSSCTFIGCTNSENRTSYIIDAVLENNVLTAQMEVDFFNHGDNTVTELKFNLFGRAFRQDAQYSPIAEQHQLKAYPNGKSYGDMVINSVSGQNGELQHEITGIDENILKIDLNEEIYPNERIKVKIDYKLTLANVIARTGYNDQTINLANFYPILCSLDQDGFYECVYYCYGDPFYSDCADYRVTLSYDKDYKIACSGKVEEQSPNKTIFSIKNARSVAVVLSQSFNVTTCNVGQVSINYYFYNDQTPEKSIEIAKKSMKLFCETFGQYPYSTYAVVQTKFIQGGMEFPALVMISDELEGMAYGEVIVHETAHQWWQTTVGNNEIKYGFLDEGLAEYSVLLFYENFSEYGYTRENLLKSSEHTFKVFCSVADKLFGKVNTSMLRDLSQYSGEYEYVNIAYIKPCIMYDTLRKTIGEQKFFNSLKKYYKQYSFKNATPYDLMGAFEKTGADSNGFFQTFFEGKEII